VPQRVGQISSDNKFELGSFLSQVTYQRANYHRYTHIHTHTYVGKYSSENRAHNKFHANSTVKHHMDNLNSSS